MTKTNIYDVHVSLVCISNFLNSLKRFKLYNSIVQSLLQNMLAALILLTSTSYTLSVIRTSLRRSTSPSHMKNFQASLYLIFSLTLTDYTVRS